MKSRFRFLYLVGVILLSAALVASLTSCRETEPVVIASDGNYRPFNFVNDDGEIDGLERELGDELCAAAPIWSASGSRMTGNR